MPADYGEPVTQGVDDTNVLRNPANYNLLPAGTYGTTANRPAISVVGTGFMYYDTTLHKPVWSDGTGWRDATGAAA